MSGEADLPDGRQASGDPAVWVAVRRLDRDRQVHHSGGESA